jgi:hypothetical protein
VVHSGDTFGAVVAVNVANNPCQPVNATYTSDLPLCLGGVARRAALVSQLRSEASHTLVVDTGNLLPGAQFTLHLVLLPNSTIGISTPNQSSPFYLFFILPCAGANYFLFSPEVVEHYTTHVGYDVVKLDLYDMQAGLSVVPPVVHRIVYTSPKHANCVILTAAEFVPGGGGNQRHGSRVL